MTRGERRVRVRAVWREEPDWEKLIEALIMLASTRMAEAKRSDVDDPPRAGEEASA